jgi:sulfite reductase alpha subunit-like flavoprotein
MAYLSDLPIIDASDPASPARDLLILYATETGNAEDSARRIARRCRELDFHVRVISTDVYPLVRHSALFPFLFLTMGTLFTYTSMF